MDIRQIAVYLAVSSAVSAAVIPAMTDLSGAMDASDFQAQVNGTANAYQQVIANRVDFTTLTCDPTNLDQTSTKLTWAATANADVCHYTATEGSNNGEFWVEMTTGFVSKTDPNGSTLGEFQAMHTNNTVYPTDQNSCNIIAANVDLNKGTGLGTITATFDGGSYSCTLTDGIKSSAAIMEFAKDQVIDFS